MAIALVVVFGAPLAWILARRTFRGKALAETIVDLPIVLPPSVAGLALLLVYGRRGLLGGALEVAGVSIAFTTIAVVVAQAFVAAPFFIRAARTGFLGVERELEEAAARGRRRDRRRSSGTSRCRSRRRPRRRAGPRLGAGAGRVRGHDHVRGQHRGPDPDAAAARLQRVPGQLDAAVAAACVLVWRRSGVLVAVRLTHWRAML